MEKKYKQRKTVYFPIPAVIMKRPDISYFEKCLYSVILAMSKLCGYCFSGNEALAEMLGCSTRHITQGLTNLKDVGLVKVETKRAGIRVVERNIIPMVLMDK